MKNDSKCIGEIEVHGQDPLPDPNLLAHCAYAMM